MDPLTLLAGASVLGGALGFVGQERANDANAAQADRQYDLARNSVRYRVQDAKAAGIHPLYALGAPTMSSSFATSQNSLASMGQGLAGAGSQISQAMLQRDSMVQDVELKKAQKFYWLSKTRSIELENAMKDPTDPLYPVLRKQMQNKGQSAKRVAPGTEYVLPGGHKVKPKAGETKASVYEDNYGEAGDSFLSPYYWNNLWRAWRDYYNY